MLRTKLTPIRTLAAASVLAAMATSCTIDPYTGEQKTSNTAKGAGIGAVAGAVLGAAVASDEDREKGAMQGAVVGAAAGGGYGYYMDSQEKKLRLRLEGTGVRVERYGDTIRLIMPGNITFETSQSNIQSGFYPVLDSIVEVVKEFNKTIIEFKGYTDSTGSFSFNQKLSEDRAQSVANYISNQNVYTSRMRITGMGPRNPVASNDTASGRAQNRRVEIDLIPMK